MTRKWETGFYQPTEKFLAITEHRAVMRSSDQMLIALCGPVGDNDTEEVARLIAAAPQLLKALEFAIGELEDMTTDEFSRGADKAVRDRLEQALAAAKGVDDD